MSLQDSNTRPNRDPARSLAASLSTVVDQARNISTQLGFRPYRLFSIVVKWSGGQKGRGVPTVTWSQEFLPTPLVPGLSSISTHLKAAGVVSRGEIQISELSARYTEKEIRSMFPRNLLPGEEHFLEVRRDDRDMDGPPENKRFVVSSTPEHRPTKFDWVVNVRKADSNRTRDGRAR